jgi:hypothetical protein
MPITYVSAGPVGGSGGDEVPAWAMPDDGTIVRIEVKWGDYVNQLLFHYSSPSSGRGVISLGGYSSGSEHVDIPLASGETIIAIGGMCGSYVDSVVLTTANRATPGIVTKRGPFGGSGGQPFKQFDVPRGGWLAGLFGRSGMWTDALGVVYAVMTVGAEPSA